MPEQAPTPLSQVSPEDLKSRLLIALVKRTGPVKIPLEEINETVGYYLSANYDQGSSGPVVFDVATTRIM